MIPIPFVENKNKLEDGQVRLRDALNTGFHLVGSWVVSVQTGHIRVPYSKPNETATKTK